MKLLSKKNRTLLYWLLFMIILLILIIMFKNKLFPIIEGARGRRSKIKRKKSKRKKEKSKKEKSSNSASTRGSSVKKCGIRETADDFFLFLLTFFRFNKVNYSNDFLRIQRRYKESTRYCRFERFEATLNYYRCYTNNKCGFIASPLGESNFWAYYTYLFKKKRF